MLGNKKGLVGKIFLILAIILVLIIAFVAISAYQAYSLIKVIENEMASIDSNVKLWQSGDCSSVSQIETSLDKISTEAKRACMNPLINLAVRGIEQIPIKCKDVPAFISQAQGNMSQMKAFCANKSASNLPPMP